MIKTIYIDAPTAQSDGINIEAPTGYSINALYSVSTSSIPLSGWSSASSYVSSTNNPARVTYLNDNIDNPIKLTIIASVTKN